MFWMRRWSYPETAYRVSNSDLSLWRCTYLVLFQFGLGGELVIGDVVDLVEFEEVAGFLVDDQVQDVNVLFVDGQDAVE